jgi:murein DD-endopeptidase
MELRHKTENHMDVSPSRGRGTRVALAISITLNIVLLSTVLWPDSEPAEGEPTPVAAATPEPDEAGADERAEADGSVEEASVEETDQETDDELTDDQPSPSETRVTVASVEGSIPQTMAEAAAPYGDNVSATLSRILVWDLDVRRDLRAGDKIEVAWRLGTSDIVVIDAARFHSQKFNRTTTAYRFKATGDEYPSYWSADGTEVPHRLKNSPLANYEQITSLLKDRPDHKGMDFKVPVGTEVLATSSGVVTRSNWNWKYNGNCIEIRHDDGVLAKYLHLSENRVKPGDRVRPGDVIALSGNTGRSTGPHLHYQLNRGKKVVDPIDYHGTMRRELPDADREAFADVVESSNSRLESERKVAVN